MGEKLRVVFLHRAAHSRSGSKIMRCDQMAEIAREHLADKYDFEVVQLPKVAQRRRTDLTLAGLKDAIVVVLKRAYATFTPEQTALLRGVARRVLIDHVDAGFDRLSLEAGDLHIAASLDALHGMKRLARRLGHDRTAEFALLLHHPDPRIVWRDARLDDEVRIGYFGLPDHALIPDGLVGRIMVHGYGTGGDAAPMIDAMARANAHYAVRPGVRVRNSWKPFTKGINAAAAGAVVVVDRTVEDAVSLLGDDYPFLIDDATEVQISAGIARLEAAPGTSDWADALDRMRDLRARTLPARTARDLDAILERAA